MTFSGQKGPKTRGKGEGLKDKEDYPGDKCIPLGAGYL
jgi:hypothetical protein